MHLSDAKERNVVRAAADREVDVKGAMEAILSFMIVLIFSGWVLHLKVELDSLEKRMAHVIPVPLKTVHAATPVPAEHDNPEKTATPAPDHAKRHDDTTVVRKGGIRTWTID